MAPAGGVGRADGAGDRLGADHPPGRRSRRDILGLFQALAPFGGGRGFRCLAAEAQTICGTRQPSPRTDAARRRFLVSLSINICEPLPALVAAGDDRTFVLQTASRPAWKVGDRAVVGWSIGGEPHELRTRVVRPYGIPSESRSRSTDDHAHGRPPRRGRYVLVAGGSLLLDYRELPGSCTTLDPWCPSAATEGEDASAGHACGAGGARLWAAGRLRRPNVRAAHTSETGSRPLRASAGRSTT